ncbi:FecR family protein [Odoribacter splanchnicus]|uniref:DUF4974 domain-containing protein n=1 Tax=Odoribacter splanchnicus TaxID=28118 RepID=A0A412W6D5_9BACT|nr:FecR family protein [Odoribacter splanchnicus]RGV19852.1 DUF4974 domain-containing protein [Odoribacter splanchnicus]
MNTVPEYTEEIARLILRRISGTIGEEEAKLLDDWRNADPVNEATYRRLLDSTFLEREWRRMKSVDVARPLADMQAKIRRGNTRRLVNVWKYAGIAAAVVIGFIVGGVVFFRHDPQLPLTVEGTGERETALYASQIHPGETKATLTTDDGQVINLGADAAGNEKAMKKRREREKPVGVPRLNHLATPRGGEFEITLEDGTKVWLNAESQLSYPDTFRSDERRVILKGEAYFRVARNEEKPFYVESDGQLVRVYGTEFNIRTYEEDAAVYTTLISGSVALQAAGKLNAELFLTPGRQAVFDKKEASAFVRTVDTEVVTGWRRGLFVFEEQNLGQIMAALARWYNFDYEFTDNVLSETVFMGSVPRYGDFNEVLEILEKSGGVKFRMNGKTVTVSAR